MQTLITLEQAREHLRSDDMDDDGDLELKIAAASAAVLDYLGAYALTFADADGAPLVVEGVEVATPARVKQAILITVAALYKERDGAQESAVPAQHGYGYTLPQGATSLLYSLRLPSCA